MALWPLTAKVRKNPLGHQTLNELVSLQEGNQALALAEHARDGKHNSLEVARAVGSFSYGAAYTIDSGSSAKITAVSKVSVGVIDVTLDSAYFSVPMGVRVSCIDVLTESVPVLAHHSVTSASSIRVYLFRLDALGGNSWTAVDAAFEIAVHSLAVADGGTGISAITPVKNGATLGDGITEMWNRLIGNHQKIRKAAVAEHTSAGVHNTRDIARACAMAAWDGAAFSLPAAHGVASVSVISTGRVRVTLDGTFTSPLQVFPSFGFPSSGSETDVYVGNFPKSQHVIGTPSTVDGYIYKYDASTNTWSASHGTDFAVSIHTAAV